MTPEDIRKMHSGNAQSALMIETCAQLAELNFNIQKVIEKVSRQQSHEEPSLKKSERTPLRDQ